MKIPPLMLFGVVVALSAAASAYAADYPTALTGKAKIACEVDAAFFAKKADDATMNKLYTKDYIEHNIMAAGVGRKAMQEKIKAFPPMAPLPGGGCGTHDLVLVSKDGNYVLFMRIRDIPDPRDATKKVKATHFDLFRFEGDKLAEHWDSTP